MVDTGILLLVSAIEVSGRYRDTSPSILRYRGQSWFLIYGSLSMVLYPWLSKVLYPWFCIHGSVSDLY